MTISKCPLPGKGNTRDKTKEDLGNEENRRSRGRSFPGHGNHIGANPGESQDSSSHGDSSIGDRSINIDLNLRAYIELLRSDVRKEKAAVIGEVMQLDAADAAKFWPIYKEYEAELTRGGDEKLALIKNYADHYERHDGRDRRRIGSWRPQAGAGKARPEGKILRTHQAVA